MDLTQEEELNGRLFDTLENESKRTKNAINRTTFYPLYQKTMHLRLGGITGTQLARGFEWTSMYARTSK